MTSTEQPASGPPTYRVVAEGGKTPSDADRRLVGEESAVALTR
jgi:hypothetical protein